MHSDLPLLVQTLLESASLRGAIADLHAAPPSIRKLAIEKIVTEMRSNAEDPEDIALISSLLDPKIFDAVWRCLVI